MNTEPVKIPSAADGGTRLPDPELAAIVVQLRRIIVDQLDVRIPEAQITSTVPLLEGGLGLDSIVLFEFITLIEKTFRFEFADKALHTAVFANLEVLARHIHDVLHTPAQPRT